MLDINKTKAPVISSEDGPLPGNRDNVEDDNNDDVDDDDDDDDDGTCPLLGGWNIARESPRQRSCCLPQSSPDPEQQSPKNTKCSWFQPLYVI